METSNNLIAGKFYQGLHPTALKEARALKGISQAEIADLIGISRQTYGKIETGTRPIKKERAKTISKTLRSKVESLFDEQGQKYIAKPIH